MRAVPPEVLLASLSCAFVFLAVAGFGLRKVLLGVIGSLCAAAIGMFLITHSAVYVRPYNVALSEWLRTPAALDCFVVGCALGFLGALLYLLSCWVTIKLRRY